MISIWFSCLLLCCNSNRLDGVPNDFIGEWETSADKYKDLIVEITDKQLLFKDPSNQTPPEIYHISKMEKDKKEETLFTIFYETKDNLEYQFAFYYEQSEGGILRFKNQKRFKWKKVEKK
jgi:hypothetical protein